MDPDFECVVIGGGAAGLAAALLLGRARRRTLVVDRGEQSNRPAEHVGGLLGQEGVAPADLYARGREQVARHETVTMREGEAVDARVEGEAFVVTLDGGEEVRSATIALATGMHYDVPDLPGFRERWGRAVFHCPFCHGWEVRDRRVVVCAEGDPADHAAALLRGWTDDVTVVAPGEVAGLRGEGESVEAVLLHDGSEIACEAVMVHAPMRPRGDLAERLGLDLTDHGGVAIDALARTSVPGVFAAGDLAVPSQVAIAIGSGHLAGVAATRELLLGRS